MFITSFLVADNVRVARRGRLAVVTNLNMSWSVAREFTIVAVQTSTCSANRRRSRRFEGYSRCSSAKPLGSFSSSLRASQYTRLNTRHTEKLIHPSGPQNAPRCPLFQIAGHGPSLASTGCMRAPLPRRLGRTGLCCGRLWWVHRGDIGRAFTRQMLDHAHPTGLTRQRERCHRNSWSRGATGMRMERAVGSRLDYRTGAHLGSG